MKLEMVGSSVLSREKVNGVFIDFCQAEMEATENAEDDVVYHYNIITSDADLNKNLFKIDCGPHRITAEVLFANLTKGNVLDIEVL